MPPNNRFRHQEYLFAPRTSSARPRRALADTPRVGSDAWRAELNEAGCAWRAARVGSLWLAHGTFVGDDPFGIWQRLAQFGVPGELARRLQKSLVDFLVRDVGNFTSRYVRELADGLGAERLDDLTGASVLSSNEAFTAAPPTDDSILAASRAAAPPLTVRRWIWNSQNNHVGRAAAALQFVVDLERHAPRDGRRLLVWCHSHAGNVLALVTNLLASPAADRERFVQALEPYFRRLLGGGSDSTWAVARRLLEDDAARERLRAIPLDVVTFGTPIRYGWDSAGYERLLHVVHHRPEKVRPLRERGLPFRLRDAWRALEGDHVQRVGIAGTNFAPCWLLRRGPRRADQALHELLQADVSSGGLFDRLRPALRTSEEGETWTVDYGDQRGGPVAHLLGHAVYTQRRWMSFHARLVGEWLSGEDSSGDSQDGASVGE